MWAKRVNLRLVASLALVLTVALMTGCRDSTEQTAETMPPEMPPEAEVEDTEPDREVQDMDWELTSPAFKNEETIPTKFTCSGDDISPELRWTDPPEGTQQLALIVDDPDAPRGTFVHWVLYGLSAEVTALPEGMPTEEEIDSPVACIQGRNDAGEAGYKGPCPPPGNPHRYFFKLYALDEAVSLEPGATKAELLEAIEDKTIAQTELMGTFAR
ncbi:MAG: YbhB/YbcL family Raf kinase inhibitor-like protein [Armatimonadota bacterium]